MFNCRFYITAKQAWKSKEELPVWFNGNLEKLGFQTFKYRALDGNVFVFNGDILITVIKRYGKPFQKLPS